MKKIAMVVVVLLSGCVSKRVVEEKQVAMTLLHQSNRSGVVSPCGCHANPIGGVDREANAVRMIRAEGQPVFYAEAGNSFVPRARKAGLEHYADKAPAIVDMLNETGIEVLAPGPTDLNLGVETLRKLQARAKFPFVSTNVKDKDGKSLFESYVILEKKGLKIAFVSMTPPERVSDPRLKVADPVTAIQDIIGTLREKADIVVALSQLEAKRDEDLINTLGVEVIVGADPLVAVNRALPGKGDKTLLVDGADQGQKIGRLDLNLALPFKSFGPDSSRFEHGLVELDEKRFGAKNNLSKLVEREVQRQHKKALGE